ncbi:DUF5667 domain-containing protein [Saccharothrix syringae]|uniref:DUF5667 domain-containing protein n=1 Tax=Saccharothrix syringae TaxID=103733 RepID=A0A5Q0HCB4_SACSY|nr:DUF5667 domain-containing protein [Saccharothrix syringae]QFZ23594.1 hypothetical protein EKG83_44660 [Saccharothrix syringae]
MWRHRQREQFARAVDAHPEPGDESFADELAVVSLLRKAAVTSGPDEAARARMRDRVLGGAAPQPPTRLDERRPRTGARGRLAIALAAALCLVFSLAGMSLLLSRDALPGDALYGVKRTAESASLGLTFGEDSKGYKRLEFASARLDELETLVSRYDGGGPLGGYLTALADFDTDAAAGSRVLTAFGANSDQRALEGLRDWAASQSARLTALRATLPAAAVDRADTSLDLLERITTRATALQTRCAVPSRETDEVGPLPTEDGCRPAPPTTTGPQQPTTTTTRAPATQAPDAPTTPGGGTPTQAPQPLPTTIPAQPSQLPPPVTTTPNTPVLPLPSLPLPSLPLPGLGG